MKLAKVRHRIMATLLDLLIISSVFVIIAISKLPFIISMFTTGEHVVTTKFIIDVFRWGILISILILVYYVVTPLFLEGQTFGKKVFKLKIVKEDGTKLDYRTLFYREGVGRIFINFASLGITNIVSIVIMLLRDDKKGLADVLAKTKVIDLYESEEN